MIQQSCLLLHLSILIRCNAQTFTAIYGNGNHNNSLQLPHMTPSWLGPPSAQGGMATPSTLLIQFDKLLYAAATNYSFMVL